MGLVVDTNVFIHAERQHTNVDFEAWEEYGEVFISAITVSELLHGVHRANGEIRRRRRAEFVEMIIDAMPILNFNLDVARKHAEIWAELEKRGLKIPAHDTIIAATALASDSAVLTTDHKDFERVFGLAVLRFVPDENDTSSAS